MAIINAVSTLVLIDSLKKSEYPISKFLTDLSVDYDEVQRTKKISSEKAFKLWEEARVFKQDPLLHLRVHKLIPYGAYHALELACLSSRTVGDALKIIVRFFNVINPEVTFILEEHHDHHTIEMRPSGDFSYPHFYPEMVIGGIVMRFKNPMFQIEKFRLVQFMHAPLGNVEDYEDILGTKVLFNQNKNAIVVGDECWHSEVLFSNVELLKSLETYLNNERKIAVEQNALVDKEHENLIEKVQRFIILEISNKDLKINDASLFLGMSTRSLQRYLQEKNTTFSDILDKTRESLAKKYLSEENMSITEIGFLLGFSEQSTFQRAFKRWTNQSPLHYRKSMKLIQKK